MFMTVREILDLPIVRAASPSLTTSLSGLDRRVTWAHSSEIFEIGPLLSGGELLLTTGLGLSGADAGARRYWIRDLAERQVAAVAIEVGRSLTAVPEELIDEANRVGIPLIRLDNVVPFERICRAVNTVIIDREGTELRRLDQLTEHLFVALASGGLAAITAIAADRIDSAVAVATASGQIVAAGGVPSRNGLARLVTSAAARAPVVVDGKDWGEVLITAHPEWTPAALTMAARRVAAAAGVAIAQLRDAPGDSGAVAVALLEDLVTGRTAGEHEFLVRAGLAGLHPPPGSLVLGVAAQAADQVAIAGAIRAAAATSGRGALVGRVRGQVLALVVVTDRVADPAGRLATQLSAQPRSGRPDELACVIGPPVPLAEAGRSLREARAGTELALPGVRTWRELAPDKLLGFLGDDASHLVDDVLGPLRRWDAAHGSDLVRTVDVYLRHGCSPSRAADLLHIRRQTLHQRLARAEELLGHRVDDPTVITTLLLATRAAARAAAPQRGGQALRNGASVERQSKATARGTTRRRPRPLRADP